MLALGAGLQSNTSAPHPKVWPEARAPGRAGDGGGGTAGGPRSSFIGLRASLILVHPPVPVSPVRAQTLCHPPLTTVPGTEEILHRTFLMNEEWVFHPAPASTPRAGILVHSEIRWEQVCSGWDGCRPGVDS